MQTKPQNTLYSLDQTSDRQTVPITPSENVPVPPTCGFPQANNRERKTKTLPMSFDDSDPLRFPDIRFSYRSSAELKWF